MINFRAIALLVALTAACILKDDNLFDTMFSLE
jgi:hypothetical protein